MKRPSALGTAAGKTRPDLCAAGYCIKVRFFVSAPARDMICSCAKERCRIAATLLRRGSANADAPTIAIHLKPWRERIHNYMGFRACSVHDLCASHLFNRHSRIVPQHGRYAIESQKRSAAARRSCSRTIGQPKR
jgi:hypothetical protein